MAVETRRGIVVDVGETSVMVLWLETLTHAPYELPAGEAERTQVGDEISLSTALTVFSDGLA